MEKNHYLQTSWYQKPLNILQTNIREIDAKGYNADRVVEYMQKTGCNAIVINAGGIVDFFQNPLPAGMTNKFMGESDVLRELSVACRNAGIKVIARIDFRGAEEEVYNKFPDWFMVNAENKPVITTYNYDNNRKLVLYAGCYLGKHRNEYLHEMVGYLMKNYPLDGIWHNAPGAYGICYCARCKASYKNYSGRDLPLQDADDDLIDAYMQWKVAIADQHMEGIKKLIKSFGSDKVYCAEIFSMYGVESRINSGIDLNNARSHFDFLVSVAFQDSGDPERFYQNFNYAGTITRFLKSMAPEREAIVLCGGNGTLHRMVSDPKLDFRIWLWLVLASGGRWWDNYFTNIPDAAYDRRNIYDHTDAFLFVKKYEKILEMQAPVSRIGIYYSRPTRISYQKKLEEGDRFGNEIRGVETVLLENHIPHDFILHDMVTADKLKTYKLIILPNVRCMSDEEIKLIKEYVHLGGNLIATYCSSLYDENGKQRSEFGLAEIFGAGFLNKKENTKRDSFQYIVDKSHHLVREDSSKTELMFNAGYTLHTRPSPSAKTICSLVPPIQNQPPDKSWVENFSAEIPTVMEHPYGRGKVFYFANQPDLLSYEIGHPDTRNLLLRAIKLLAADAIPIATNAPSSVQTGLTKSLKDPGNYILSLVNTSSSAVRPVRKIIPVENIRLSLKPDGKRIKGWEVIYGKAEGNISKDGKELNLVFRKLDEFCSVHITTEI